MAACILDEIKLPGLQLGKMLTLRTIRRRQKQPAELNESIISDPEKLQEEQNTTAPTALLQDKEDIQQPAVDRRKRGRPPKVSQALVIDNYEIPNQEAEPPRRVLRARKLI